MTNLKNILTIKTGETMIVGAHFLEITGVCTKTNTVTTPRGKYVFDRNSSIMILS